MSKTTEIVCPLCERDDFKSARGLKTHLRYCKEKQTAEQEVNNEREVENTPSLEITAEQEVMSIIKEELGSKALKMILNATTAIKPSKIAEFLKAKSEGVSDAARDILRDSYQDSEESKGYFYESNHYVIQMSKCIFDMNVLSEKEILACRYEKAGIEEVSSLKISDLNAQIEKLSVQKSELTKKAVENVSNTEKLVKIASKLQKVDERIANMKKTTLRLSFEKKLENKSLSEKQRAEIEGNLKLLKKSDGFDDSSHLGDEYKYISFLKNVIKLALFKFLRAAASATENKFYEEYFKGIIADKVFVKTRVDNDPSAVDDLKDELKVMQKRYL